MDLALTTEQNLLKQTVQDFVAREFPKERVREVYDSPTGFAPDLWQQMSSLGWAGLLIPAEYDGLGSDFTTLGVLFEELGAGLCPGPLLSSSVMGATAILEGGSEEQKRSLLPGIARGERILAFAFTESDYGWGPEKVALSVKEQGGEYVLNGTKMFVPDAHIADQLLVVGRSEPGDGGDGLTAVVVDQTAPGVSMRTLSGWLGDKMNEVTFRNVKVAQSALIGPAGGAWPAIEKALDVGAVAISAYMVGGCRRVFEMSIERSQTRIAFGVAIGTLQHVQAYLVEMANLEEATRWSTFEALWKMDEGRADAPQAISMAKAIASDSYFRATEGAHHIHAGLGVDMDYGLPFYTQKARTLQNYLGDLAHHRDRMATFLELDQPLPAAV
jgi:alkylation response protein AidB-like acyl-CoA dehydrogenase